MAVTKIISGGSSHAALHGCLDYVLREDKTSDDIVFMQGPYDEEEGITPESVYEAFLEEKRTWNKDSGRMYYHTIVSFHQDEKITPESALDFGMEYADRVFHDHQVLVVVHEDKAHLHIHFVVNSVNYIDGHKFHSSKHDLEAMKHETDRLCEERELTITKKGHFFSGRKRGNTFETTWNIYEDKIKQIFGLKIYVMDCAYACMNAMRISYDRDSFIDNMKDRGWDTVWEDDRKHITFINEEGEKVRDSNISKKFRIDVSKDSLEELFSDRDENYEPEPEPEDIDWKCEFLDIDRGEFEKLMERLSRKVEVRTITQARNIDISLGH